MDAPLPPHAGKAARQRFILRSAWFTLPATFALVALGHRLLPPPPALDDAAARLVLAARWLVVALLPYAAMGLWISLARLREGAHNPLLGQESERLRIHCRVMQNTLEQLVWFAVCVLALAAGGAPAQARLIPLLCTLFAAARLWYWHGYLRAGTLGRAPGMQVTLALNGGLLAFVCGLLVQRLAG